MSGVYCIRCTPTRELYVGGTLMKFAARFTVHRSALRHHNCAPPLLQAAWDKYGEAAFEFIPIKEFPPEDVNAMTLEAIRRLGPTLNRNQPSGRQRRSKGEGESLYTLA